MATRPKGIEYIRRPLTPYLPGLYLFLLSAGSPESEGVSSHATWLNRLIQIGFSGRGSRARRGARAGSANVLPNKGFRCPCARFADLQQGSQTAPCCGPGRSKGSSHLPFQVQQRCCADHTNSIWIGSLHHRRCIRMRLAACKERIGRPSRWIYVSQFNPAPAGRRMFCAGWPPLEPTLRSTAIMRIL
jgi:hypothetical protein